MYAGRKRKKPIKKTANVEPPEEVKSNPSRRHRERVNAELEQLAGLLPFPEEVTSKLDKLSVLRLTVSYLRAKTFFNVAMKNRKCPPESKGNNGQQALSEVHLSEMELILQALDGFVVVITAEGDFFYTSRTIQDYLGFHQSDVLHQPVFEFIHTEDRHEFHRQLHWAWNPTSVPQSDPLGQGESWPTDSPEQLPLENWSFKERNFVCRFRCLLDNSAGFQVLNIQGRLKFLHGRSRITEDGSLVPAQFALFAIASPLQTPSILEIRTKSMIFRTKHKLDFTPMSCDAKGKIILGYSEAELCMQGTGYQFIHAADMLYCAENHVRMVKTGESGLTVFRLLTKEKRWTWVQANARLVYKNGRPEYIIATQRPLMDGEGEEHLSKRSLHLPFTYSTGEAVLYEDGTFVSGLPDLHQAKQKGEKAKKSTGKFKHREKSESIDPNSLLGALMKQDESVYVSHPAAEPKCSFNAGFFNGSGKNEVKSRMEDIDPGSLGKQKSCYQDGVLATLETLSENSQHNQVNVETQSTLQNLGVEMEDLELLLLDEKQMQVKIDPNYAPSLSDFLTNHEILSYVHDSLMKSGDGLVSVEEQISSAMDASKDLVHGRLYQQPRCSQIRQHQTTYQQVGPIQKSLLSSQVYMDNEGLGSENQICGNNQPDQRRQQHLQTMHEMGMQQQQNNVQESIQNVQQQMRITSDHFCNLQMQANRMSHNLQQRDENLQCLHLFEHNEQHHCKISYKQHMQSLQSHATPQPAVNVLQQMCRVPNHQQHCSRDLMQQCHNDQGQSPSNHQELQHCIQEGVEIVQQEQNQTIHHWPQSVEVTQCIGQECCNVLQWPKLGGNMVRQEHAQMSEMMGPPKDKGGNLQVTWPENQQSADTNRQQQNCGWFTRENCPFNSYGPEQPVNISCGHTAATHEWQMIHPNETTAANCNSSRVIMKDTTYPSGSEGGVCYQEFADPLSSSCISAESFLQMMTEDQPTNNIGDIFSASTFQNENFP
ncbi:aryl hydrocarbon receptor-like [Heterodontus francisci]|uniref:aryl hydrocarbon receptor-like n=1 Tax=Heterodontus francisci TaxID=7792 RepID=UPI00355BD507